MDRPKRHQQKAWMSQGAACSQEEICELEASLSKDPESVSKRFKIIGFYNEKLRVENSVHPMLFRQLQWIMQTLPNLPLMPWVTFAFDSFDRDQMFEMYKTVLDTLAQHEHSSVLLGNVLVFLRSCGHDPDLYRQVSKELEELRATV